MRKRYGILIIVLCFLLIFSFSIVLLTNWNLKRIYYSGAQNTFYLLSSIVENHLNYEKSHEEELIFELRQLSLDILNKSIDLDETLLSNTTRGIWLFSEKSTISITTDKENEKDIIRYYKTNLSGHDSYSLIFLNNQPYYMIHFQHSDTSLLFLSKVMNEHNIRIHTILDSLVSSSTLVYFSILDSTDTPIIYSSLYENFLPLQGEGNAIISTPVGMLYHIEKQKGKESIVAGFSMKNLVKTTNFNVTFLVIITVVFIVFEAFLLCSMARFDRFRVLKEKEVTHFKELSALSIGFTHEFRNSLNTLSLLAEDLKENEHKNILSDEINRMRTVMDSLKMTGQTMPQKQSFPVIDIINESISMVLGYINKNDLTIEKDLYPGLTCLGSRTMLVTLFSNLISNSIEAGATVITIIARKKGNLCEFKIHDNGAGITISPKEKVFEPFYSNKQQTGLGLYLVRKIVELHDGSMTVGSNGGTTFTIDLK